MLSFSTSSLTTIEVAITCDTALDMADQDKVLYLKGQRNLLKCKDGQSPTLFVLKALSPAEREDAEIKAGAYTRSELGRMLYLDQPSDSKDRAYWHDSLTDKEKTALAEYNAYLNRVYQEMIKVSCVEIKGVNGKPWDLIQSIKPDIVRVQTIGELVAHISNLSLLGEGGK